MAEQRYLLTVAHQPGRDERITKGVDGQRDFFTGEQLERAAWTLLQGGAPEVGLYHVDGTVGHAQVVESYIYRGPDWVLKAADGSEQVVKAGTWLVGLQCDDVAWDLWKRRLVTGVSLQGVGKRIRPGQAA